VYSTLQSAIGNRVRMLVAVKTSATMQVAAWKGVSEVIWMGTTQIQEVVEGVIEEWSILQKS
jgi:precorrin-4 methylase